MTALGNTPPPLGDFEDKIPQNVKEVIDLDFLKSIYFVDLPITEIGVAKRLVGLFSQRIVWCKELGWLRWNGKYWERDALDRVIEYAKLTTWLMGWHPTAGLEKVSKTYQTNAKIKSIVSLAHSDPDVAIKIEELDTQKAKFCFANGTLDLDTMQLESHNSRYLITKMSPVEYRPELGVDGIFKRVLSEVLEPDVWEYLIRLYGYALSATAEEHVLPILWGNGQNGKTLIQEFIAWVFGNYAVAANEELLIERKNAEHPTEIARLFGARLVYCSETGETARLNEKRVKKLTGGNTQTGRFMHKDFFDFEPTHLLTVDTNYKPLIRGSDDGIWRRVSLIPFSIRVADDKKDEQLAEKLRQPVEASKALNLILAGYSQWKAAARDCRLCPPIDVAVATQSYRSDMDDAGRFVAECCIRVGRMDESSTSRALYTAYCHWATGVGQAEMTETMFGRKLTSMGFENVRPPGNRGNMVRVGLVLKPEWAEMATFGQTWN